MSEDYEKMYHELLDRHTEYVQLIYERQQRENEEKLDDYIIIMADGTIHEDVTNLYEALQELKESNNNEPPEILSVKHRWLSPFKEVTLTKE